jgi:hypothetical protein
VQKVAVVFGEPHDRRALARAELRQRPELVVLLLLERWIDGPAVRTAIGARQPLPRSLDHVVRERPAELVRVDVRLRAGVPHEVREQPLDDPVLAHHVLRALASALGEQRLLPRAALDQPLGLEPLQHLPGRRAGHAEHLGNARRERKRAPGRRVLADRKGEKVDRLQIVVDGMARHVVQRISLHSV